MRLKTLLFLLMLSGIINAQEPYRSLVISEVRLGRPERTHIELTNMGNETINVGEFKLARKRPWGPQIFDVFDNEQWDVETDNYFMLPEKELGPGESFVVTAAYDFGPKMYNKRVPGFSGGTDQLPKQTEIYELADMLVHMSEANSQLYPSVKDSAMGQPFERVLTNWGGRTGYYIEHHFAEGDSAVVDQVNGNFDNDGRNFTRAYDVAGVVDATDNSLLVRKFSIKTGNLDFANAKGVGLDDSEWMPITYPDGYDYWRELWWTVGNHGDYVLDENTLESDVIDIDFGAKTLTVPWGIRRLDGIMKNMVKKPGIAWNYHLNSNRSDSLYRSVRTGDQLTVYVVGAELQQATFDITVAEPTADANIVVPIDNVDIASVAEGGAITDNTQDGILGWPRVTQHESGDDTITGSWHGLPNALRTDSLMKYLEKPPKASWEFIWVDGVERADLKDGDKLKVTADNGEVKEYYLQVQSYDPSHNADLTSITWPDIPDFYRGIFGWIGDTIPNFTSSTFNYTVQVPFDVDGIPALVAKSADLNANIEVKRAVSLSGSPDDRSIEFKVTAEDDSVENTYTIQLTKEKNLNDVQPYYAEPFLSEFVFRDAFSNNFIEICNPGNQPLDLSDYMFIMRGNQDPAAAIQAYSEPDAWMDRFRKYIPGYKWVDEADWSASPAIAVQDLSVNSIVQAGDVFCMGQIKQDNHIDAAPDDYVWPIPNQLDVSFSDYSGRRGTYESPWSEDFTINSSPVTGWYNASWFMFKILNDSIKLGLKPANDPNDFELLDIWGMSDGSRWIVAGEQANQVTSWKRKPEIYEGNPVSQVSFGTNPDDSEWIKKDEDDWNAENAGWPWRRINVALDIGQHFMNEPTHYMSTVSSLSYKVSEGYKTPQEIRGLTTGSTVADFMEGVLKKDEGQSLTVKSSADGSDLAMDDVIALNDTLVVLSADSTNTTKYVLDVTDDGLSSNAVLTSDRYTVDVTNQPQSTGESENAADNHIGSGTISGFEYGTLLQTVLNNIDVPMGANLTVVNADGGYVPLTMLNFDTSYVEVTVTHEQYFEVVAENGTTTIVYQLQPQASESSAFITSDVYSVDQRDLLVEYVPRGTAVNTFLLNVVPSLGASAKIVDKFGMERTQGNLVQDDRVIVTSPDGTVQTVYYLSMLATEYITSTTYLAYVTSNVYSVSQLDMVIYDATAQTEVATFLTRIDPAMGATAFVVDMDGNEKTSGDLDDGDMLKVVSADGKFEAMYNLNLDLTSADLTEDTQITLYPNPTSGKVNVSGVSVGGRIQVFNSTGSMINDVNVRSNVETISLNEQPSGMYLIVVSDESQLLGRFKVLRK